MVATEQDNAAYVDSLWQKYRRQRTIDTRNQLAEYYLPLVKMVAGRLAISLPSHVDKEDLLSSGFFGLLDAIDRYDFQRKNKFETYAGVRVRGAMLDYLRSKDWVPVTMRQKIRRYEQAVYDLENELGRPAKDEELAERLNISLGELSDLVAQLNSSTVVPLEEYLRTDGSESPEMSPVESIELRELQDTLAQAIDRLPEKEKLVISLYYYEDLTLREISLIMHLTEARISQMHTKAVFRLRGYLARMKADLL
ncbi:MAG: FliA/WhiG family RNA polymerase sigma factor [Selenomonadaceae bacterium]|nr:FliA/WhiG family RNA polymerase sigma factor [Selenomonadaceae bacterium]MBQ1915690.1 FliA/WhiG family RNA polymerase sigma factor [Selenomonadaceae bacterium]